MNRLPARLALLLALLCAAVATADDAADEAAGPAPLPADFQVISEATTLEWDQSVTIPTGQPVQVAFAIADANQHYRIDLDATKIKLWRVNGSTASLAQVDRPTSAAPTQQLLIRRRETSLYLAVDRQQVVDILDGTYHSGPIAAKAAEGVAVTASEADHQPVEPIYFTDDFMRTKEQQDLGVWRHVSGKWRFYSVLETNEKADPKLSVNPFSLGLDGDGQEASAVVTGHPFWMDYDYQASLRSRGGGWAGIIFSHRADDDFFLLRCDLTERHVRPRRIELVRMQGGEATILAAGTALLSADQWYRMGVRLRGSRAQCLLDDDVIFDRVDPAIIGGPVGLWTAGVTETLFDDVVCVTNYDWPMDREHDLRRSGIRSAGTWRVEPAVEQRRIDGDPGPRQLIAVGPGDNRYVVGDPAGTAFRLDAVVRPTARQQSVGLLFAWRDDANHHFAQWQLATGRLVVGRVVDGETRLIGQVQDELKPGQQHEIALDLTVEDRIHVYRDGALRMRAPGDSDLSGRMGVAANGPRTEFENLRLRQVVTMDTEVEVDNSNFAGDPFMLHWASSLADWFPVGTTKTDAMGQQVYWHKGDFYQSYQLEVPAKTSFAVLLNATEERWLPPADKLLSPMLVSIPEVENQHYTGDGYALHLVVKSEKERRIYLLKRGALVRDADVPEGVESLAVCRDGSVTWIAADDGTDLLVHHDHQPPTGPRVAIRVPNQDVLFKVKCRREGIIDEIFERAPAAWVQQGRWIITNRFSCTPTWSHMTATERAGLGALWHKQAFPGNVTVEYYAGMRMQPDRPMYYARPGDFNITFGARPFDLASGISLIPGAWDQGWTSVWTRFARGNEAIVETDRPLVPRTRENGGQRYIPVPYISAGRDVHGAWYYVKSRYVDGHLEGFFDNVKVLESSAPALDGDRVAVWTQGNEIVIARMRITYQQKSIPRRLLTRVDPADPAGPPPPTLFLTTAEAGGLAFSFDESVQGWDQRDPIRGVRLATEPREGGGQALVVTNELPGCSFEAVMPLGNEQIGQFKALPLTRAAQLRFDYRLSREAKVNLYLTIEGRRYSVPLTGVADDSPVLPVLYRPTDIVADETWRTAVIPLSHALRQRFGTQAVTLTDLRFGQLHEGYLLAGFGGNPRGAWYAVDNLAVVPEVKPGEVLTLNARPQPVAGSGEQVSIKAVRWVIDQKPNTQPNGDPQEAKATVPAGGGPAWLHFQAQMSDDSLSPVVHQPLYRLPEQPAIVPVAQDQPWGGGEVRFRFAEVAPAAADFAILDKQLAWDGAMRVDAATCELVVDTHRAGLVFSDGQEVPMKLAVSYPSGVTGEVSFTRTFSLAADQQPPAAPEVGNYGEYYDFEQTQPTLAPTHPDRTALELVGDAPPHGGKQSLRIVNLLEGSNHALSVFPRTRGKGFDLGRNPVLMFDYKVAEPLRSDFVLYLPYYYYQVPFTDNAGSYPSVAAVANATRDNTWRRATVNLQEGLLTRSEFTANLYDLRSMTLADYGYSGAAPGASYEVDNLRFVPLRSGKAGFEVTWAATDPSGVAAYRYGWGSEEGVEPTVEVAGDVTKQTFHLETNGLHWFAICAVDGAGNVSDVTRLPFLIDNEAPAFGEPSPKPGPLGVSTLTVPVTGVGPAALDPVSLRLTVGKTKVGIRPGDVNYNARNNTLTWHWTWPTKSFSGAVADGTAVPITLEGTDLAGNAATTATWEYKVSYAADKQPPPAPAVTVKGQPVRWEETFTEGLGTLITQTTSYRSARSRVYDSERRDYVLEAVSGSSGLYLTGNRIELTESSHLSFDYKLSAGVRLHVLLYLNNTYYQVELNGKTRSYRSIGSVPVADDGKWHTCVIDLLALAQKALPNTPKLEVRGLILSEEGTSGARKYWLDNLQVFGPSGKDIAASWLCYDPTGIAAGAVSLGADLNAAPPTAFTAGQTSAALTAEKPGLYLLQARSRDGAGNEGGAARRVILVK